MQVQDQSWLPAYFRYFSTQILLHTPMGNDSCCKLAWYTIGRDALAFPNFKFLGPSEIRKYRNSGTENPGFVFLGKDNLLVFKSGVILLVWVDLHSYWVLLAQQDPNRWNAIKREAQVYCSDNAITAQMPNVKCQQLFALGSFPWVNEWVSDFKHLRDHWLSLTAQNTMPSWPQKLSAKSSSLASFDISESRQSPGNGGNISKQSFPSVLDCDDHRLSQPPTISKSNRNLTRKMNASFFRVLILAAVLALTGGIGYCELIDCDKASCPDSPVMVQFEHLNCSGAQRFFYLNETWNGCKDVSWGPLVSSVRLSYTDAFYVKESYTSQDCDKNLVVPAPTSADFKFFGICRPVEPWDPESGAINYLGKMFLKSANQSFVSPQIPVFIPDVPELDVGWKECANIWSFCLHWRYLFRSIDSTTWGNPAPLERWSNKKKCTQFLPGKLLLSPKLLTTKMMVQGSSCHYQ